MVIFMGLALFIGVLICYNEQKEHEKRKTEIFILKRTLSKHIDRSKYWQDKHNKLKLQTSAWILEKEEEIERLGELLNGTDIK